MARVTASDASRAHPRATDEAVLRDRLLGVQRAGGLIPAARREPREQESVGMDERDAHPLQDPDLRQPGPVPMSPSRSAWTPARARSRPRASRIARWSAPTIAGRAITSTSQPGRSDGSSDRIASRSRRRTRFRTTAEPRARPVAKPNRVVPSSVRRTRVARSGCDRIDPRSWSARKSCGLESITSGGARPRPVVRPTGVFDRGPGVRPERGARPDSSCGRESHAPWRGDASWAGRSASSWSLRVILSIRPRGSVRHRPQKARKRADRPTHGRGAFIVRRMIGRAAPQRQTQTSLARVE
jgi:hypothetical protein